METCLICFTNFNKELQKHFSQQQQQQTQTEPDGGEGGLEQGNKDTAELFRKFLLFSHHFLLVPKKSILPFLNSQQEQQKNQTGASVFCGNCEAVVSSICKLYKELCEVQVQLAWKLGQLGELIGVGNNGEASVTTLDRLGSQLHLEGEGGVGAAGGKLVEELRATVALQCNHQFQYGHRLEARLNAGDSMLDEASSVTSDSISVGVCCEVEVDIKEDHDNDHTAESQYFASGSGIVKGHFLFDQSSSEESPKSSRSNVEGKKAECHQCRKLFAHKYSLEKHLRTVHGISTTFSCPDCSLQFGTRQQQQQHRNEFHGKRKAEGGMGSSSPPKKMAKFQNAAEAYELHKCSECGNQFSSRNLLMDHMLAHRKKPKKKKGSSKVAIPVRPPIPANWKECPECGEGFPPSVFYYHVRKVHGQGPRHVCPQPGCGKEFLFPTGLKRHLLHHGEKRFVCPVCQKKFSQFPTLRKHSESQHGQILEMEKSPSPAKTAPATSQQPSTSSGGVNYGNYSGSEVSSDSGGGGGVGGVSFHQAYHHPSPNHQTQQQQHQQQIQTQTGQQRWMLIPSWPNYGGEQAGGLQRAVMNHPQ